MTMSATATIRTASHKLEPLATESSLASSDNSSLIAIQNSSSPPASFRYCTSRSCWTTSVKSMRKMIAAPAPIAMPRAR